MLKFVEFWANSAVGWVNQIEGEIPVPCFSGWE